MPLLKNLLPLRTIALRYIARNLKLFWKKKWKRELRKITEASDDILLDIRKDYLNPSASGGGGGKVGLLNHHFECCLSSIIHI